MYVLAIYGSPRRGGNTELLLDAFLNGITTAKPQTQIKKIYISNLKISPCQGDNVCLETGECDIKDEMTTLYDELLKADIIALAAPVFFYSVPAQVKIIIDRCQALWARKYILKQTAKTDRIRKGFFISTGGTKGENIFTGMGLTVKYFFKSINVDYSGNLLYNKIDSKEAIKKHPTALKDAFQAGHNLVSSL